MSYAPPKPPSEGKNLVPILVIGGILLFCCLGIPLLSGLGAAFFWQASPSMSGDVVYPVEEISGPVPIKVMPPIPGIPAIPEIPPIPSIPDGRGASGNKQALYQEMAIAEQQYRLAQAQYDAAQAVYEQQRNFALQQGGRLGAQGIRVPQPQPPDPSLYQQVLAAQSQYEAAKAAYEAAQ